MASVSTDVLIHLDSSIDVDGITGYYIPDDGSQHVIIGALNDAPGDFPQVLSDVHWLPGQGVKHNPLAPIPAAGGPAGYYAPGEGTQHVLAGTRPGDLIHVYWKSSQDIKNDVLLPQSTFALLLGSYAGYYIPEEGTHHAIVTGSNGEWPTGVTLSTVTEVYWRSGQSIQQDELARFTTAISLVGAYYIPEEGTQHAIIAAPDGTLTELYWKSGQGVKQDVLPPKLLPGLVPLTNQAAVAFYSADDHTQHVVVLNVDGTLTDIHWQSGQGVHQDVLTKLPSFPTIFDITGLTGYYSANDQKRHVIVGVSFNVATGGTLTEFYW